MLADLEKLKSFLVATTKTSIYSIVGGVGSNGRGSMPIPFLFFSFEMRNG